MPKRLSTILNLDQKDLYTRGVFNGFVDIDSQFHLDPSLLDQIDIKEFKGARKKFKNYFKGVLSVIKASKVNDDRFWRETIKMLTFKEVQGISLGHAIGGNHGNGVGKVLATRLTETTKIIIDAGINDPVIFELVGLFEEGYGPDRISDMTIVILIEHLINYTQRICKELTIDLKQFRILRQDFHLPENPINKKPLIFTPRDLLKPIPIAYDWEDIESISIYNDRLRAKVNKTIGNTWKRAIRKTAKVDLKSELLKHPELIKDLLKKYKLKQKKKYDYDKNELGEKILLDLVDKAINEHPLNLRHYFPATSKNIFFIVKQICEQFQNLIENNGWFEFLYNQKGELNDERFPQKLFFGIAENYCQVNNLDLSREANAGSGALDFKLSQGYSSKVTVEMKYDKNSSLISGVTKQLPTYNQAEKSYYSIYLVIRTRKTDLAIRRLKDAIAKMDTNGKRKPDLFVIDGRWKNSASKRK
ncbi:MAG: hypothetical protein AAF502_25270 [Bacteroidota bacterium]